MHIPTVRVANPADPTAYMTINAADYRPLVHGDLWHEQHSEFDGLPPPPPASYSEAERRFAADLMLETVAFRELALNDREFHALPPTDRMTVLRDARDEFERSRNEYTEQRKRQTQVSEQQAKQTAKSSTLHEPGFPSAAELNMTDEQYGAYVAQRRSQTVEPQGAPAGVEGAQEQATATAAPTTAAASPAQAHLEPAKPAWAAAKQPEPPAAPATTVEKGVGGKYYVMRGGKPLSPGFPKKADAEAALPEYTEQLAT